MLVELLKVISGSHWLALQSLMLFVAVVLKVCLFHCILLGLTSRFLISPGVPLTFFFVPWLVGLPHYHLLLEAPVTLSLAYSSSLYASNVVTHYYTTFINFCKALWPSLPNCLNNCSLSLTTGKISTSVHLNISCTCILYFHPALQLHMMHCI